MTEGPYNPLDKLNLARSIENEVLSRTPQPLETSVSISGSGVYLIYYNGDFDAYKKISSSNAVSWSAPIYVGKAIPKGGRKGGISQISASLGTALAARLRKHADSIKATETLHLKDFVFRHVILDDIWIPLGENILIDRFKPLWNIAVEGFGINDPGKGRLNQKISAWDILHPGRGYAKKLKGGHTDRESILGRVDDHLSGRSLRALPKGLAVISEKPE